MDIKRFIANDIRRSVIHNKYRIFMCAGIILTLMITFYSYANSNRNIKEAGIALSFFDYILYMIRGGIRVTGQNINRLEIPYVWISLCIMNGIMVLDYMYSDMKGIGRNVLVYSRNKSVWWLSKCITTVVSVSIVYILMHIFAIIFSIIGKGVMSGVHTDIFRILYPKDTAFMPSDIVNGKSDKVLLYIVFFPWIISVGIGLFQLALSLYVKPVLSFIIVIIIDGLSVFSNSILLWGNWFMAERCDIFVKNGHNTGVILIMAVMVCVISVIAGEVKLKNSDVI